MYVLSTGPSLSGVTSDNGRGKRSPSSRSLLAKGSLLVIASVATCLVKVQALESLLKERVKIRKQGAHIGTVLGIRQVLSLLSCLLQSR